MYWRVRRKRLLAMVGVYAVIACFSVALLQWGTQERVLPAFSPVQSDRFHEAPTLRERINWRNWLESGFLYVLSHPEEKSRAWLDAALRLVSGVRLGDIKSLLDAEVPVFAGARLDAYLPVTGSVVEAPVVVNLPPGSWQPPPSPSEPAAVQVGIYHTHARESFLPDMGRWLPNDAHTDDMEITVVKIGQVIASLLSDEHGIGVVHSPEVHDAAGKVGSYIRSELTVQRMLREYPDLLFLFDVHRDSAPRAQTVSTINGVSMARLMIVLGTDHERWRENYALAKTFIEVVESLYPGLSIGIYTKPGRYNQHLSTGGLLLEVGGVDNTMEECLESAVAVARVIAHMIGSLGED